MPRKEKENANTQEAAEIGALTLLADRRRCLSSIALTKVGMGNMTEQNDNRTDFPTGIAMPKN